MNTVVSSIVLLSLSALVYYSCTQPRATRAQKAQRAQRSSVTDASLNKQASLPVEQTASGAKSRRRRKAGGDGKAKQTKSAPKGALASGEKEVLSNEPTRKDAVSKAPTMPARDDADESSSDEEEPVIANLNGISASRFTMLGLPDDSAAEADGFQKVTSGKKARNKPLPSATGTGAGVGTGVPTKKQRENAAKREKEKLIKQQQSKEQEARREQHRREQARAQMPQFQKASFPARAPAPAAAPAPAVPAEANVGNDDDGWTQVSRTRTRPHPVNEPNIETEPAEASQKEPEASAVPPAPAPQLLWD